MGSLAGRDCISLDSFSDAEIQHVFEVAQELHPLVKTGSDLCRGKILSEAFYEPSTRTQFSFSSAMQRLGGGVLGFSGTSTTSIEKGESLKDTAKMLEAYSDIMVLRHYELGSQSLVADAVSIPVINGGEGVAEHPSQTLYDLYTIRQELGRLDVTIGFYGDLKYGRTNHSLLVAGSRFGAKFYCVAPKELQMPESYLEKARKHGASVTLLDDVKEILPEVDVLYVSRLQKERLSSPSEYESLKKAYFVNSQTLAQMKEKSLIMHPLPRVGEISEEIDEDPRAAYFRQAANGVPVRMAILALLLGAVK